MLIQSRVLIRVLISYGKTVAVFFYEITRHYLKLKMCIKASSSLLGKS